MQTLLATFLDSLEWLLPVLKGLGLASVVGFLGLWGSFLSFPPYVVVETDDVSDKFNSQSQLKLKNTGKLPALELSVIAEDIDVTIGNLTMDGCGSDCRPHISSRLAFGETTTIPILDFMAMGTPPNAIFSRLSFTLRMEYNTRLIFFTKKFKRVWSVDLNQRPDGFNWIVKNLSK